jgi:cyclic pyranopterin phosphate synthase
MVDVSGKAATERVAIAQCEICMSREAAQMIRNDLAEKGQVIQIAILAGIQAAKKTSDLIPLCHAIPIESVNVTADWSNSGNSESQDSEQPSETLVISATVRTTGKTGVEMEALVAANLACLTVYDMCKSVDRSMLISNCYLVEKTGGKSGSFRSHNRPPAS